MLDWLLTLSSRDVLYALDIFGVMGCAMAGTIQAYRYQLDPLGAFLIASVTAIGGGTVRDLLLDRNPVFWLVDSNYLIVIFAISLIVQIFFLYFNEIDKILRIADAVGLATFTIIGIEASRATGMSPFISVFMGVITSCFGGVMRDIICNEVPLVLRQDIYIAASVAGGVCFFVSTHLELENSLVYVLSGGVVFVVRILAIYRGWNLPSLRLNR
ncbi:MAG: trimeric intracellular cation channel family protein [Gammaproteobacteria bacterium]|nr:trimeric intracellular cation channel family protein [Gammaproteobacteria bacterium]